MSAYRNKSNVPIDFDTWRILLASETPVSQEVVYDTETITITKKYMGTVNNVFKVFVGCSSDITKYSGYIKGFEGEVEATNDYNRLIQAIEDDEEIFDGTVNSELGEYSLFFDQRHDLHFVSDRTMYPVEAVGFLTRSEAQNAFDKLSIFGRQLYLAGAVEANYNTRHDKYLVIDRRGENSTVISFDTAELATNKYNELIGN